MKKLLQILGLMLAITGMSAYATPLKADISSEHIPQRSEERRVGKECRL